MWQDPTDLTKRKPRRLRGTPANKVVTIVSSTVIGVFCAVFFWYSHSEAAWVQRNKERVLERIKPKETEEIRREMFRDPIFGSVLRVLNERTLEREYAEYKSAE